MWMTILRPGAALALLLAAGGCAHLAGRSAVEPAAGLAADLADVRLVDVAPGWADNSVNAVIFRRHALVSDGAMQFIAFYDADGRVVLGKRALGATRWELAPTQYQGNVRDAQPEFRFIVDYTILFRPPPVIASKG